MRGLFLALSVTLAVIFASPPTSADAQADEIQDVITSQIEAFKIDDFATAFTFAAPTIQNMFRTPQNFGRMVSQGYPMVWRPADVTYLDLRTENGLLFQDVEIIDANGQRHLLEYRMTRLGDAWKISGVRVLKAPGLNA